MTTTNKKPLKDWTLGELQVHCNDANCDKCVWRDATLCAFSECLPREWDLTDPPRWTRDDVEDAKAIKRIYSKLVFVERRERTNGTIVFIFEDGGEIYAPPESFPNLNLGECVPLQEILDAEEGLSERRV